MESDRPDALFRDVYARRLAGDDALRLVRLVPAVHRVQAEVVVRTAVIDEMILASVSDPRVDAVVTFAAGLDTRPYRLPLPPHLTWVEVDHPELLDAKRALLEGEIPRCHLRSVGLNLADRAARRALLQHVARSARSVVIVTDGVLSHLSSATVAGLAADFAGIRRIDRWLTDISSPEDVVRGTRRDDLISLEANVESRFAPAEGPTFFEPYGWVIGGWRTARDERRRLGRLPLALRIAAGVLGLPNWSRRRRSRAERGYVSLTRVRGDMADV